MPNVKGSALASRVLWVQLGRGAAGMDQLVGAASPGLRASLGEGITKSRWYPFEQFVELNLLIDQQFGAGDLALVKELGRHGADANLRTIYRLFFKVGATQWVLSRAGRLWNAHYDSGYLDVTIRNLGMAVLRILAFPTPHPTHCLSVLGWCERAIELSGGRRATVVETQCRTRGDHVCQLEAAWE